ncbi:MAG: hypothetical protein Q9166_000304 [cf. Caloplaca sp. 2 TL-2023]
MPGAQTSFGLADSEHVEASYNASTNHTREEPEHTEDICNMMLKRLPQELVDMVEDWLYEIAFCPGFVYPLGKPYLLNNPKGREVRAWEERQNKIARPNLLTLSKYIWLRYDGCTPKTQSFSATVKTYSHSPFGMPG